MTDEENGRAVIARAGVRLARAKAVRWRNIVLNNEGGSRVSVERRTVLGERKFGG